MPRTKGSYQKRTFLDTSLGRFIYLLEPTIFTIIGNKTDEPPNINLIILLCEASGNPSFQTKRFYSYVNEYKENGLRVKRKKKITPQVLAHYKKIRDRRILKKAMQ